MRFISLRACNDPNHGVCYLYAPRKEKETARFNGSDDEGRTPPTIAAAGPTQAAPDDRRTGRVSGQG